MTNLTVIREIDPSARIASDVHVGPYCVIGPDVTIGSGTRLDRRVMITGHTTIGSDNVFEEGCILGCDPQDIKYAQGPTLLVVGDRNHFERLTTAHIGTELGGRLTRIGNDNVFRIGSHVAHDCYVDNYVTLGRYVLLAGHIRVGNGAIIGDFAGVHHFTTIGRYSNVKSYTPVRRDVPPYTDFYSNNPDWKPATVGGINGDGIRSANLKLPEEIDLRRALRDLFTDESTLQTKIEHLVNMGVEGDVAELCEFCQRSLHGVYGRYREIFRNQDPPEAKEFFDKLTTNN